MQSLSQLQGGQEICSSSDENFIYSKKHSFTLQGSGTSVEFTFSELSDFDDYKPEDRFNNFKKVRKILGIVKTVFGLESSNSLDLFALEREDLLFIFAIGEVQPSRYMIILEGVFEIKS